MQALYGYYRDDKADMVLSLRNLKRSIDRIYELYLYDLCTLKELHRAAEERIEILKNKKRPTEEDLNPNLSFVNNRVLRHLEENLELSHLVEDKHISWAEYRDQFKKVFNQVREDEYFLKYMNGGLPGFSGEKKIVKYIYAQYICNNEFFHTFYEDLYIHWADDLDAAQMMTTKTIKTLSEDANDKHGLVKLFKDKSDEHFGPLLFRKVISNDEKFEKLIGDKTKNWETDRIAVIDIILMKMALAELTEFPEIPIKVTLNEYIELSKQYSTPKSGNFINGILDKLVIFLKENNQIEKVGRGLL